MIRNYGLDPMDRKHVRPTRGEPDADGNFPCAYGACTKGPGGTRGRFKPKMGKWWRAYCSDVCRVKAWQARTYMKAPITLDPLGRRVVTLVLDEHPPTRRNSEAPAA